MNKLPYTVPSMAEVNAIPWNGFNVVSTFSGCGGSCLGYRMAGFRILYANEFVPAAQDSYKANTETCSYLDTRDIRIIRPEEILEQIGLEVGEIDLLDGSPPCASFSTAGKREAGWGKEKKYSDTSQRTDDLFFEYIRILRGLMPKVFIAENVSGLIKGTAKGYFKEILAGLKASGYNVKAQLLDAQWLGVPQMRQRIIFQGVRNDLGLEPVFPKPLSYRYSVRDALPWIGKVIHDDSGQWSQGDITERPSPTIRSQRKNLFIEGANGFNGHKGKIVDSPAFTIQARRPVNFLIEPEADISRYAIGREWDNLKPGEKSEKYLNLVKVDPDRPCNTITAPSGLVSAATVVHPTEKRRFTIAELRRICGFPDDFILTGTYAQQWERLGRAVPPVMMFYVAKRLRDLLFNIDSHQDP